MQGYQIEVDPSVANKLQDVLHSLIAETDCAPQTSNDWEADDEFQSFWNESQREQIHANLKIFEDTFLQSVFNQGRLIIKIPALEPLLKSISYLRLYIQEKKLKNIDELSLEKGDIDLESLDPITQEYLWGYSLLAQFQEIILTIESQQGSSNA